MSDTSIKISLQLADAAANKALENFIAAGGRAEKGLDKLKNKGTNTFHEISLGIGRSTGILDIFAGNLAANLAIKGFEALTGAAKSMFDVFVVDGVKGAAAAQDALNNLNSALASTGIYTPEVSAEIVTFAEELQALTRVEDDVIIKNAALIQNLAQLDKDGLQRTTKAAVDLAAGLAGKGLSVEAASEALAKAANGNVTALQKMGIQFQKGANDAQTFENVLSAVEQRFGGQAQRAVLTFSGAVDQAKNNFGNWTEEIGNLIVQNPAIIAAINQTSAAFVALTSATKESGPSLSEDIAQGFVVIIQSSVGLIATFDVILRATFALFDGLKVAFNGIGVIVNGLLSLFSDEAEIAFQHFKDEALQAVNDVNAAFTKDTTLSNLGVMLAGIGEAAEQGLEKLRAGADSTVQPINNARGAVKGLSDETVAAHDRLRSFAMDLVKQAESSQVASENALTAVRARIDGEIAEDQRLYDQKLITEADYLQRKAALEEEFETIRQEIEKGKYDADLAALEQARANELITESQFAASRKQLDDNYRVQRLKGETDFQKLKVQSDKAILDEEEKRNKERKANFLSTVNYLQGLQQSSVKELFFVGKAAAIAQATIDGYAAVQKALASAPPPINFVLAGLVGAVTATNISRIASQQPPAFQDGGIVGGNSFTGDRVAARVNSGEMILNRSQQSNLFRQINSGGNSSGNMEGLLTRLIGAIESQAIIVNVGGKTVVDTIRSELASGRAFA